MGRFASRPARRISVSAAMVLAVAVAIGLVALRARGSGQTAPQSSSTFRADSDAVWMAATVLDRDGRLVTDLGRDDFEIFDNGQLRPLTFFRNDVVPFSIVVMLDVSGSVLTAIPLVRRGMLELVS